MKKELVPFTKGESLHLSNDALLEAYIKYKQQFVDDEGDVHSNESPYYRNEEYYCCGEHLHFSRGKSLVLCLVCGSEYRETK